MSKFKVGDRVRRLTGDQPGMKAGNIYKVTCVSTAGELQIDDGGWWKPDNFELVSSDRRSSITAEQWQFQSKHISDINWEAMASDLSYKNPLLLVERGDRFFVVVSNELYNKAMTVGLSLSAPTVVEGSWCAKVSYSVPNGYVFETKQYLFSAWIAWAKKVKAAPWPNKDDQVVKVKVAHI